MTQLTSASILYIELTYKTRKNPPKIFFSFDCTASFGCEPPDAAPCPASAARWWSPAAAGAFTKLGHLKIQREYVKNFVLSRKNTYLCYLFIDIYIFSIHYRVLLPHLRLAALNCSLRTPSYPHASSFSVRLRQEWSAGPPSDDSSRPRAPPCRIDRRYIELWLQ